jgi:hypothetical protein
VTSNGNFKQINKQDATVSQVYYLKFTCRSACFGGFIAHHQELATASTASGFYLWSMVVAALLVIVCRTRPKTLLPPRSKGKNQSLLMQL